MRPDERVRLIYAALELGINTFELQSCEPEIAAALGEALSAVERRMVFVAQRVGWGRDGGGRRVRDLSPEALVETIETSLSHSRLGRLDVVLVDVGDDEVLSSETISALQSAKAGQRARMLGVAGAEGVDRYLTGGEFDVLATAFNIQSGWSERNRLRRAVQADMPIIGYGFQPFAPKPTEEARAAGRFGLGRLLGGHKGRAEDAYAFLERTGNWTAEEICLGFALTEPSLTTIETRARSTEQLQRLASVVERELPTGMAAQIEMARFSTVENSGAA
jgi:aryl-alcohol dehydrogenase-like predicted oxidoreductase